MKDKKKKDKKKEDKKKVEKKDNKMEEKKDKKKKQILRLITIKSWMFLPSVSIMVTGGF